MTIMPAINAYQFGKMTIGGRVYTSDLFILPSGDIIDHWRRESGHLLVPADIRRLIATSPERIIIGTGASGRMQVDQTVVLQLKNMDIQIDIHPCKKAVLLYNQSIQTHTTVGACFHLTC